jgi:hypothetical protein
VAARLLLRALAVERDEAGEDVVVAEVGGPAIGVGDGGIEAVVQLLQDQHQAIVEDAPVGGGESGGVGAGAQLLQHVVEAGEGQVGVFRQDTLAVGVELFGDFADRCDLNFMRCRKGEWIEATRLDEARSVLERV